MKETANNKRVRLRVDFHVPIIKMPQADGSLLVRAGKLELTGPEVTIAEFARQTGISARHVATLCEQGDIKFRHLSHRVRSKILIPRSELERYADIQD